MFGNDAFGVTAFGEITEASSGGLVQSSRFNNTNTFYAPTVTTGPVTLTQSSRFDNVSTFYSPTVSLGGATQTLLPSLFANVNTFYSAAVSPGPVSLAQSARFDNVNAFYSAIVTIAGGPQYLVQSVTFNNSTVFYSATVTQTGGTQTLTQDSRFDNSQIFYSPTVGDTAVTLSPADIAAIADAVWAKVIEGMQADEMMRIMFAALAGERSGIGSATERYFSVDGSKARITFTPIDGNGNGATVTDGTP